MVATIAYTTISGFQLHAIDGQLQQMKGASGQTDQLLSKTDSSISQATRLATATETANANVIEADRPWIGASIAVDQTLTIGNSPTATIVFTNSGKRPARVTLTRVKGNLFEVFPKHPLYDKVGNTSQTFLVPGAISQAKFKIVMGGDGKISKETLDTLSGKKHYFIYGEIVYADIVTNKSHETHTCWKYLLNDPASPDGFYNCSVDDGYQDAN